MPLTIDDSGLATKDSSEVLLYVFDFDDTLEPGVELIAPGTLVMSPPTGVPVATNQALQVGNRAVQVLLSGGSIGRTYHIELTVVTNENPAQTFSPWFRLRIT